MYSVKTAACLVLTLLAFTTVVAQQPAYKTITAVRTNAKNPFSPDPLFNYQWPNPADTGELEIFPLLAVSFTATNNASFNTHDFKSNNSITVNGTGSIRFDFGQTNAAWLEFDADSMPDSVTMSISEYNEPAILNAGALNRFKTLAPVRHGNTYRLELNPQLYEGVRFGWIHVLKHTAPWRIKNVRLVCQVKPVNYRGSFSSSDTMLNKIWYTGAYTVRLNLMQDYLGAILMERSDRISWTGDAYPSQAASMVAFGNFGMIKANLVHTSTQYNGIESYALYWVLSLVDYVNYSGDTTFGSAYINNASQKLDNAYKNFGQPVKLGFYGWDERLGAGFENPNNAETNQAYKMLSIHCWAAFSKLAEQLGYRQVAAKYAAYAAEKFAEVRKDTGWLHNYGIHAAADAINTGLTTAAENNVLYNGNYKSRVNRLSYSPFNQYFILQSQGQMGKYEDALSTINDCWGGQIRYGGTTFFEDYRPSWNKILPLNGAPVNNQCGYTSLTHPWSAGVTKWLSEEVLGIKPLSPGFPTFQVIPHMGNLTFVNGATPTPHGLIKAAFNAKTGMHSLTVPAGTVARVVRIPLIGELSTVYINEKLVDAASLVEGQTLTLTNLTEGEYRCRVIYKKLWPVTKPVEPAWDYKITRFTQDTLSGGHWLNKYGKNGYILFNALDSAVHLQHKPAYLDTLVVKNAASVSLQLAKYKQGVLTGANGTTHNIGAYTTKDPIACLQTMTLDVTVNDDKEHQLALYFFDWDGNERRSAVELFDLKTLSLLAPVQLVERYGQGKYLVFKYSGSIRIRINQVRGTNAAISGIFFDEPK